MKFNKSIYPDEMKDRLEEAVINSAEGQIRDRIEDSGIKCDKCGSDNLKAKVVSGDGNNYQNNVICSDCDYMKEVEVEVSDLKSSSVF